MKRINHFLSALTLLFLTLGTLTSAFAQITPSQDSYTNTNKSTTNYGAATTLGVASSASSIQTTYIKFDLSSIPPGYTSANVAKATLKLYVNSVTTAGSFNVDLVIGNWAENTITSSFSPALGGAIASSIPLTTANVNDYVLIDVTSAVGEWLNGSQPNDGLAFAANSGLSATFDSKENTNQSHPAELDIVFSSGLPTTCSSNQILQWNGNAWACGHEDTGTVSSVGLSAPPSDFTVSNSPVTGTGTLNLSWNVAPSNSNVGNSIVKRDPSGNFAAGVVTASTVEAAGVDTASLFSSSALTNGAPVYGQNTATAGPNSYGVYGQTESPDPAAASVFGYIPFGAFSQASAVLGKNGEAYGVGVMGVNTNGSAGPYINGVAIEGYAAGTRSEGVWGIDVSNSGITLQNSGGTVGAGVWGDTGVQGNYGLAGTSGDGTAGYFENNSTTGYAVLDAVGDDASSLSFVASNRQLGGFCYVDSVGDLVCSGAKNAVVPVDGGQRHVALAAIESPKNWFEDFGSAQLAAGAAVITLEPDFAQTVNTGMEYHVFLTPKGDCKGLYVANETAAGFEVHELGGGASSVSFDYRIVALRKNFEGIRLQDHTKNVAKVKASHEKKGGAEEWTKRDLSKLFEAAKPTPAARPTAQKAVK